MFNENTLYTITNYEVLQSNVQYGKLNIIISETLLAQIDPYFNLLSVVLFQRKL